MDLLWAGRNGLHATYTQYFAFSFHLGCSYAQTKTKKKKKEEKRENKQVVIDTTTKRTTPGLASFQGPRLGSNSCGSPGREVYEESPGRHECVMWRDLGEDMKSF